MSGTIDNARLRKLLLSYPDKAIEILYDLYYDNLLRVALLLTHEEDVAEDIVQETYLHVWENNRKLGRQRKQSILPYLVKVVKNKSIAYFRDDVRTSTYKMEYEKDAWLVGQPPSIETRIIRKEVSREVRELISTFPRSERECLLLRMDEELPAKAIGARLGVTEKAVERSLGCAYKRLRKYWAGKR